MRKRPVISPELRAALERLELGSLVDVVADRVVLAEQQDMAYEDLLLLLSSDEISRRDSTAAARRAEQAGLDPDMVLERGDETANVSFEQRVLNELVSLRFIDASRNVVILGPVGVGKTFMANALGHIACRYGYHVLFRRADQMLETLAQSRFDNSRDLNSRPPSA